ncbi:ribosomal RNA processing protein 1 homolog [Anopheles nili]|uniref:ribosomal RNA processing protein 1 homolog n=1 Tax=Anopheles nili TaxID=185578 RepID=UPI00237B814B|nr:ribosomal RNA processing protein 1 homolog [Anopheles nili]
MVVKDESTATQNAAANATMNSSSDKASIIAQEIKFARALAGNDATLRRRVLKNLKTWLNTRSQSTFAFSDADFLRLWKGLFYCMWMSDKPLVQEELAESLGSLVGCFSHNVPVAMQFFKAFMVTMGNEWFGLDRWRMDKFMMLVRRVTRHALLAIHENGWQTEDVDKFAQTIEATILDRGAMSYGLMNHFNDLILNEIAKVSEGEIPTSVVTQILEVYIRCMLKTDDSTVCSSIKKNIFHALMQQSELGQMYEEKFQMWKNRNFVTGNIDNVEFHVSDDDEEENDEGVMDTKEAAEENQKDEKENSKQPSEGKDDDVMKKIIEDDGFGEDEEETSNEDTAKVYDPRAGKVNVDIPQIMFDPQQVVALFEKYCYKSFVTTKARKRVVQLVKQFKKFAAGEFPLGIKRVPSIKPSDYAVNINEKVIEIENFRKELFGEKRKSLKERKKEKRLLKKQQREQNAAKKQLQATPGDEDNDTPVDEVDIPADDCNAAAEADNIAATTNQSKKLGKKQDKLRKTSSAKARKQIKLDLLQRRKDEKMKLLKERLKKRKDAEQAKQLGAVTTSSTNGFAKGTFIDNASAVIKKEKKSKTQDATVEQRKTKEVMAAASVTSAKKKQQSNGKDTVNSKPFQTVDEWSEPLKEGEQEYFIPSRKAKSVEKASKVAIKAKTQVTKRTLKRVSNEVVAATETNEPITPGRKRVKIALNKNVAQDLVEHIKQVKSSPQLPFDSRKKPSKSLLKPNLIPSPINPFYKKKIGLK